MLAICGTGSRTEVYLHAQAALGESREVTSVLLARGPLVLLRSRKAAR